MAIQLAKKSLEKWLEKPLEKPLEISYTGKTPKMGSLDMSQNQNGISSRFSSQNCCFTIGSLHRPVEGAARQLFPVDNREFVVHEVVGLA